MMTTDDMLKLKAVTLYIFKAMWRVGFHPFVQNSIFCGAPTLCYLREASGEGYVLCVGAWSCSFFFV